MRWPVAAMTAAAVAVVIPSATANADLTGCDDAYCTPGITPGVVLGASCANTSHYVFGTTSWGRLVFCGSPRRYEPRYFRSPSMAGIKEANSTCTGLENRVAQAPDGRYLICLSADGSARWVPGDV